MNRTKKKRGCWLNRYDCAYSGQDTVNSGINTLKRIVPGLIQNATKQVVKVAEKRIAQERRKRCTDSNNKGGERIV